MANFAFAPVRSRGKKLTTTSATALYTVDERSYAQIIGVRVANVTAVAATITLAWFSDVDTDTFTLIFQQSVPGNQTAEYVFDVPLVLNSSDELRATAGTANAFHITTGLIETPGRSG